MVQAIRILPVLRLGKPRHQALIRSHVISEWEDQGSNQVCLTPQSLFFLPYHVSAPEAEKYHKHPQIQKITCYFY